MNLYIIEQLENSMENIAKNDAEAHLCVDILAGFDELEPTISLPNIENDKDLERFAIGVWAGLESAKNLLEVLDKLKHIKEVEESLDECLEENGWDGDIVVDKIPFVLQKCIEKLVDNSKTPTHPPVKTIVDNIFSNEYQYKNYEDKIKNNEIDAVELAKVLYVKSIPGGFSTIDALRHLSGKISDSYSILAVLDWMEQRRLVRVEKTTDVRNDWVYYFTSTGMRELSLLSLT